MLASRFALPSVVLILLEAGADPTRVDHEHRTALQWAKERECTISSLDESITDKEIADNYEKQTEVMASLDLAN